ncbi:MAG TPA: hypothetical protein DDY93_10490 [Dehalococcoidia bacterium]|jgi:hypothetical protein|nr:hypothetical protein [Dehalococcoidia bacterium]|tara:strand:- start:877 stop:1059 length:183 start_codon:yes stop_codon:yes gene_type:complete
MRLSLINSFNSLKKSGSASDGVATEGHPQEAHKLELLSSMDIFQDLPDQEVVELMDERQC